MKVWLFLCISTFCIDVKLLAESSLDSAKFFHEKAVFFEKNEQYDSGMLYYNKAAALHLAVDSIEYFLNDKFYVGYCALGAKRYVEAEDIFRTILEGYSAELDQFKLKVFYCCKLSYALAPQGKAFEAYEYALQAKSLASSDNPDWLINEIIGMLACASRYLGFYNESLRYCNELLALNSDSLTKSHTYNTIGLVHKRLRNKETALRYYLKCMQLRKKHGPEWVPYVVNNIADLYFELDEYDSALHWANKGLEMSYGRFGKVWQLNYVLWLNKSRILYGLGREEDARQAVEEGYEILNAVNADRPFPIAYDLVIQQAIYVGSLSLAKILLDESRDQINEQSLISKSEYYYNFANYYKKLGKLDSALWYYNASIKLFKSDSLSQSLERQSLSVNEILDLQRSELGKLEVLNSFFKETGNEEFLVQAVMQIDYLLSQIIRNDFEHISLASASSFFKEKNNALGTLLEASSTLFFTYDSQEYLENVARIMETKRLNTLKREFAFRQYNKVSGIPDSVLIKRRDLQAKVYELLSVDNLSSIDQDRLLLLQRELELVHLRIKEHNHNFYATINADIKSLMEVEQGLNSNEYLLQFSFTDNKLFTLVSEWGKSKLFMTQWDETKEENLGRLIQALRSGDFSAFSSTSKQFLTDIEWGKYDLNPGKIRVMADKRISLVPFEALKRDGDYLISDFEFVYMNSLLEFDRSDNSSVRNGLLAFAPFANSNDLNGIVADTRSELGALPASDDEVNAISKVFMGNTYLNERATESIFKQKASQAKILHLATHSVLDNNNSMNSVILFSKNQKDKEDGVLHTYELLQMQLNAELVTLSACNTGVGKYYEGEGLISLATGFNIAGVGNVVMSLWPVPDNTTAEIMEQFYSYISAGLEPKSALRQAKLDFLESVDSNLKHPYYWAGFIIMSDHWSGSESLEYNYLFWIIGLFIVGLIAYRFKVKIIVGVKSKGLRA